MKNFGGILEIAMHSIEVECLPKDLPEVIRIDVSALNVGDAIHIKDIQLPEGVTARADGDLTVVRVAAPKVEVEPEPAAEAAQPEVIKEKKDDAAAAAKPAAGAKSAAAAKPAATRSNPARLARVNDHVCRCSELPGLRLIVGLGNPGASIARRATTSAS